MVGRAKYPKNAFQVGDFDSIESMMARTPPLSMKMSLQSWSFRNMLWPSMPLFHDLQVWSEISSHFCVGNPIEWSYSFFLDGVQHPTVRLSFWGWYSYLSLAFYWCFLNFHRSGTTRLSDERIFRPSWLTLRHNARHVCFATSCCCHVKFLPLMTSRIHRTLFCP